MKNKTTILGSELEYAFCDDWNIYAKDKNGNLWWVSTEMWEEWLNHPEKVLREHDAVERYMLPAALRKWDKLCFQPCL